MSWLKEFVDIDAPIRQFMEDMTMTGSAAENFEQLGADISKVVVGKILTLDKHPNADKLLVCQVDIGSEAVQIVTGATNLNLGDYVPVALHGATLTNGLVIKKGKLRGEVSNGMLCSIEELGYTRQDYPEAPEDGIYVFEQARVLGADVKPILQLEEEVVEFELYSNRIDCQSIIGMAREVAATYGKTFVLPEITLKEKAEGNAETLVSVEIKNPELCPRYVARMVKNVKLASSPQWLRRRLSTAGVRPINNIVDITNYVMLEYGQPLHAFDIDHIAENKIVVRTANPGEKLTTLDGVERNLDETMLVIADTQKPLAIAGVMGGENSKVTGTASAILFESASFDATNIRLSSKKLGMRTDASAKFGKGVEGIDPNLPLTAVNRAMELIELLECGEVVPGVVDNYPRPRKSITVNYKPDNINKRLGTNICAADMEKFLALVNIEAANGQAKIPTFRSDITEEADIAEEVARFYGYDNIPVTKAQRNITGGGKNAVQRGEDVVKRIMCALGYSEALTNPFEGPKIFEKLQIPPIEAVTITSPLGEDHSLMRTTPFNGMLSGLAVNFNRRNETARLFELTKVYLPRQGSLPEEKIYLVIGAFDRSNKNADFFDLKGDIEELFAKLGIDNLAFAADSISLMHPGRTAQVCIESPIGHIGELHPDIANNYEIGTRVYVAALELAPIIAAIKTSISYQVLPKFPSISRDIALQVKTEISAATIEAAIWEKGGSLLVDVALFDVYQGKQVEEGYKSMAYNLGLRAADRTLTDEEAVNTVNAILDNLQSSLGIQLRGTV